MLTLRVLVAALGIASSSWAMADSLLANPFASAAEYRKMREALPAATLELHYRVVFTAPGNQSTSSDMKIAVAADWSLVTTGAESALHDFRLNRVFTIGDGSFRGSNGLAQITFRITERQNRALLARLIKETGVDDAMMGPCDADAELGVAVPGDESGATVERRESRHVVTCDGREMATFTGGSGSQPPAAFWPTIFNTIPVPPVMYSRMKESGYPPAAIETSFRRGKDEVRISWQLVSANVVSIPYPLASTLLNETGDALDTATGMNIASLAAQAIAGRAADGAPTATTWGKHLTKVSATEGRAAAAMLIISTYNMFPQLAGPCRTAPRHQVCDLAEGVLEISKQDPAPLALMEVGLAEQNGKVDDAIAAMKRAQSSPLRDHPALGAAFALALVKFGSDGIARAQKAGLPTDVPALQEKALTALPYNPAYWTDVGDRFAAAYRWDIAYVLYEIAVSLPMPEAVANNPVVVQRRGIAERIRRDFPDASLPIH